MNCPPLTRGLKPAPSSCGCAVRLRHVHRRAGREVLHQPLRQALGPLAEELLEAGAHATLVRSDFAAVDVRCEAITFIEVVEHLDPPLLESVGAVLLGRCRPRWPWSG